MKHIYYKSRAVAGDNRVLGTVTRITTYRIIITTSLAQYGPSFHGEMSFANDIFLIFGASDVRIVMKRQFLLNHAR